MAWKQPRKIPLENGTVSRAGFPIVGIGASAGGLEALKRALEVLPVNTGMAFVLIQHLDPTQKSALPMILSEVTRLPVLPARHGIKILPDTFYVTPAASVINIERGVLKLQPRDTGPRRYMPIDHFFNSLAVDQKERAVGIVLSGTGSDGALGLQAIKAGGGIAIVQSPSSAKFDGMPVSALSAGSVDYILPPERIGGELGSLGRQPFQPLAVSDEPMLSNTDEQAVNEIFEALFKESSVDFSSYKLSTIHRRLSRRMALHKVTALADYAKVLRGHPEEVHALYEDLLINVTEFFRDPDTFKALDLHVFPKLVENREPNEAIRFWVPGCSTGEEVYSVAMALMDFLIKKNHKFPIQIFGSDISEKSLERARSGIYVETIAAHISPDRLRRYFVKLNGHYQVSKTVRDVCVFARQDVTRDPPFSRLDLISCRNILIYLGSTLQKRVIPIFHYALKPNGFLCLGSSETIGTFSEIFNAVDKRNRIYMKKAGSGLVRAKFFEAGHRAPALAPSAVAHKDAHLRNGFDLQKEADRIWLTRATLPSLLLNDNLDILQFRGNAKLYLDLPDGKATLNVLKMAKEGLTFALRSAVQRAKKADIPARAKSVRVKVGRQIKTLDLEVVPIGFPSVKDRFYLVIMDDRPSTQQARRPEQASRRSPPEKSHLALLQQEIKSLKENLRETIEDYEGVNEELKAAHEEVLSSNEELQSTNEELETAKEELQSANEELITVNEELQNRNVQLTVTSNDLMNLISSVEIPILMVDHDLRIRRFTPAAARALNLLSSDVGRPFSDIADHFQGVNVPQIIRDVMSGDRIREQQVQDKQGRWYSLWIKPYKTPENKVDGAVILYTDIDIHKKLAVAQTRRSEELSAANVELEQFAYVASHDLQEPLRQISDFVDLWGQKMKDSLPEDCVRDMDHVHSGIDRMRLLIQDLLLYSRSLGPQLIFEDTDVNALVQQVVAHLKSSVDATSAVVTWDRLPTVHAPPTLLFLVFQNLIGNAITYKRPETTPSVHVSCEQKGALWQFSVQDNGLGLDMQDADKIFGIFQRLHTENKIKGTGIGLAICKRAVERMGGKIWVHSEPSKGATFFFTIPLHDLT